MGILIFGIALSFLLSGAFNSQPVRDNLLGHSLFEVAAGQSDNAAFATGMALIRAFLNRTQEAMGMYLLLLFGLQLKKATK